MWKLLDPGQSVQKGDLIRYRPGLPHPAVLDEIVFDVIKTDQHYFVVAVQAYDQTPDLRDRSIIKYMDIGYNIMLEIWSGQHPKTA